MKTKQQLESQLMLMGLNGMAYTPMWNEITKELNKLKEVQK